MAFDNNLQIWAQPNFEKPHKTDTFVTQGDIEMSCPYNGFDFACLRFRSSVPIDAAKIRVTDLTAGNEKIEGSSVKLFLGQYHYIPYWDGREPWPDGWLPDGLIDLAQNEEFAIPANDTGYIWIQFKNPTKSQSVSPLSYTGQVQVIDPVTDEYESLDITINILDYELPAGSRYNTAFFLDTEKLDKAHALPNPGTHTPAAIALFKNYYQLHLEYSVSPYFLPRGLGVSTQEFADHITDDRLTQFVVSTYLGDVATAFAKIKELGMAHKAFRPCLDEPVTLAMLDTALSQAADWHAIDPDFRCLVTFHDALRHETGDGVDEWVSGHSYTQGDLVFRYTTNVLYSANYIYRCTKSHVSSAATRPKDGASWDEYWEHATIPNTCPTEFDIYCCHVPMWDMHEPYLTKLKEAGKEIWHYASHNPTLDQPDYYLNRTAYSVIAGAWHDYRVGSSGQLYFRTNWWDECTGHPGQPGTRPYDPVNPWYDQVTFDAHVNLPVEGKGSLVYPGYYLGEDRGYPSIRLCMLALANQDYTALKMVEDYYGEKTARSICESVCGPTWSDYAHTQEPYEIARKQIARLLSFAQTGHPIPRLTSIA